MAFELLVNGTRHTIDADPQTPLLWVIRDQVGLTGTKFSCGIGQCGACTLHVDGRAVRSCSVPAASAIGKPVMTIEGLSPDGSHPIQIAWKELDTPQCGYCQSGHDHEHARAAARTSESDRRRHRRADHQRLPLQHVSPHPPGDSSRGTTDEGAMTAVTERGAMTGVDRREFLATLPPRTAPSCSASGCRRAPRPRPGRYRRGTKSQPRERSTRGSSSRPTTPSRFASRRPSSVRASGRRTR